MSDQPNARARLQDLASRLNISLDDLVGDLVSESPSVDAAPAPPPSPTIRLSDAAIRAAISDSYSATEVQGERDLLEHSHVVFLDGRRRLRLSDAARSSILREASGSTQFKTILEETVALDKRTSPGSTVDGRSVSLRQFLTGETTDLSSLSPAELRCAVAARERLRDVQLASGVPQVSEAQRLLERAELLEPLRISIGATGPWNAVPAADRFVGRIKQLRELRSFVDEIESEGVLESIVRNASNVEQTIRRGLGNRQVEGIRFIAALGGLGKSALIAKFVLDHALRQGQAFPFAYLDFDRAAIQPRDPRQLLLEVARQVALQFPQEAGKELGDLRERIRQSIAGMPTAPTADPFDEFRQLIQQRVTLGHHALLVVLDTVEIVQSDPKSADGLFAFLERLSRGGFTELRLVAAGRAEWPELMAATPSRRQGAPIKLEPLSYDEALDMVRRLGQSLLPSEWKEEWTPRLAGKRSDAPARREPLSLRVAVETLRDEKPERRDACAEQIERLGEGAAESFVGKLYENRVVAHVAGGENVRKIAWPGLVVRRVSVDIIRELLAPTLGVDPSTAQDVFNQLATQVWIVVRDGDTLKHQPDLRARTLPLMRRKPEFGTINEAAIDYFGNRQTHSDRNRAEWIYHRLLAGQPIADIDKDWSDTLIPFLNDARNDFPPDSPQADYLSARTANRILPDHVISRLSLNLALEHLARTGRHKASLADRTLDPLLRSLDVAPISTSVLSPEAAAVRICLLVKTGRWYEGDSYRISGDGPWQEQATAAIAFRQARLLPSEPQVRDEIFKTDAERSPRVGWLSTLIQELAIGRVTSLRSTTLTDSTLARQLESGVATSDALFDTSMLRTAMVFGSAATIPAARVWALQITERFRGTGHVAFSAAELRPLMDTELRDVVQKILGDRGGSWEQSDRPIRFDDPQLAEPVIAALMRRCERRHPEDLAAIRRFAAARDADWLTPFAYAAHRATDGHAPPQMGELYESHQLVSRSFLARSVLRSSGVPKDMLEALQRADEASDLASAVQLVLKEMSGARERGNDLWSLFKRYQGWREAVRRLLEEPPPSEYLA